MELTLTDDQEFFRDTTRRFLAAECPLTTVRSLAASDDGFDRGYWRQGAELGWTSLLVGETHGGGSVSGDGVVDLTIVAEAFGRQVAPGPLVPCNVVACALSRSGSDEQRGEVLTGLLNGDLVAAWCGADLALDPSAAPAVTVRPAGDGFVLDGSCAPVEAGAQADHLLVSAIGPDGPLQFLLPAGTAGIVTTPLRSVDLVRRYARIDLAGVEAAASTQLGAAGSAPADLENQLHAALVVQAAEMLGAAERTFEFTLEWAFDRYSFGRPLASYQEIKHRFADMKMWLEASHGLASALAREVQAGAPTAAGTASATKAYAGDHLPRLLQDCLQLHGGIGLTADHDIHLYLRRITADRSTFGTPAEHRQRLTAIAMTGEAA